MDFFEHQQAARRNSFWLIAMYVASVALIIVGVYLGLAGALLFSRGYLEYSRPSPMYGYRQPDFDSRMLFAFWDPHVFAWVAGITLTIVLLGTLYKVLALSGGGASIAQMMGGRLILPDTTDFNERRILNVVEEMAIASGTPVPPVYLLDKEEGINAFAAGFSPRSAVIAVTLGCATLLTRDELQGVIGHEFSHILNGDMRLNIKLIGLLNGILIISIIGYLLLRGTSLSTGRLYSREREGGDPRAVIMLFGAVLVALGSIGVFFGKLIKSAVSRQREYLADASSVQFTRNPSGLAGALKKIGGYASGSRLITPRAEEASHMFFAHGLRFSWFHIMATHPPLAKRIKRIEPDFSGDFDEVDPARAAAEITQEHVGGPEISSLNDSCSSYTVNREQVLAQVGAPTPAHLDHAQSLLGRIPPQLRDEARNPYQARSLIYALLIGTDEKEQSLQLQYLASHSEHVVYQETLRILGDIIQLDEQARLPLIDLAIPSLKLLSVKQYEEFCTAMQNLIMADGRCTLYEYALARSITCPLDSHFGKAPEEAPVKFQTLGEIEKPLIVLHSALAYAGKAETELTQQAFTQAVNFLFPGKQTALLPLDQCSLDTVDEALRKLLFASPALKKSILGACCTSVIADNVITVQEAELLRAIASSLDCPLPPFL